MKKIGSDEKINLKYAKKVTAIDELNKHILSFIKPVCKDERTTLRLVSKHYHMLYPLSEKELINYCDNEVNPRLAYCEYKCKGQDLKYLSHYGIQAILDMPWKEVFGAITLSMLTKLAFYKIDIQTLVSFPLVILMGFTAVHIATLVTLYKFGYCINAKPLFRGLAVLTVLLNFVINAMNSNPHWNSR